MRIAIYDLDRTLIPVASFTPFLHFAAARIAPWRLLLSPVWIGLMLLYKARAFSRTKLKQMGVRLMAGSPSLARLEAVGAQFARRRIARHGWMPGTIRLLEEDRRAGAVLVIATAAFGFYARSFAEALDIHHVIATRFEAGKIKGGNCYGQQKLARFEEWMEEQRIARKDTTIRFVSDSFADAPLLDFADEAIFVTGDKRHAARAEKRGWKAMDLRC